MRVRGMRVRGMRMGGKRVGATRPSATRAPLRTPLAGVLASLLVCTACGGGRTSASPTAQGHVAPAPLGPDLSRGVNITRWFRFPDDETDAHYRNYITDADLTLIEQNHFTVVRLNVAPDLIMSSTDPSGIDMPMLAYVDMAVKRINAHHLAVILDLHDEARSFESAEGGARLERFWHNFALHFASTDPRWVAFELLNEPVFTGNAAVWDERQTKLIAVVRAVAPRHTIIATGADWGGPAGLAALQGSGDDLTVYSAHLYEPFAFTHQGADWAPDYQSISGLEFPPQADNCARVLATLADPGHQLVQDYCDDPSSADPGIALRPAIDWARQHHRRLFVGEFGVYCLNSPRDAKLRWFDVVMPLLTKNVDGWAVWGYDDCFGLDRHLDSGQVTVDKDVLARLTASSGGTSAAP